MSRRQRPGGMGTKLTLVPLDIETTGLAVDDEVTVLGFVLPIGARVFLQTDDRTVAVDRLQDALLARFDGHLDTLDLTVHDDEQGLLEAVEVFATERLAPREYLLTAYNGDKFRGGFDLPFLRTRYARQDADWPFVDLPYADLLPIFQDRFNTMVDGDGSNNLERVYDVLVGGDLTAADPFADSGRAVAAFEDGSFEALLAHNVADICRTAALGRVAERFCSKSEFKMKSLTPTSQDSALR
jgi:uncharacterized protein YprB with RNaseH-like and TPR domain